MITDYSFDKGVYVGNLKISNYDFHLESTEWINYYCTWRTFTRLSHPSCEFHETKL